VTLTVDPVGKTATFTAEAGPWSRIFQSTVKAAGSPTVYSTTFKVCVKTTDNLRLAATNEQFENNATSGWTGIVNARIRSAGGGGSAPTGTGIAHVSGGAFVSPAAAVNLAGADVTGVLPMGNMASPTGTGFAHVTSGATDAASALLDVTNATHVLALQPPPDVDFHPMIVPKSWSFDTAYPAISKWSDASLSGFDLANSASTSTKPTFGSVINNQHESITYASASSQVFANGTAVLGQFLANSASQDFVLWVLFNATSVNGTSADATMYNNEALWADTAGYVGIYLQNLTGTYYVAAEFFDTAARVSKQTITLSAWHLIQYRKSSGNIYTKLDNGSESAGTAVSTVGAMSGVLQSGKGTSTNYFNGQMLAICGARGTSVAADTAAGGRLQRTRLWLGSLAGIAVT
jgi:hypothetical protein